MTEKQETAAETATRRALWTKGVVDNVDGVPFCNLGDKDAPRCVSTLVTDARMERWLRLGYQEYTGDDGEEIDHLIATQSHRREVEEIDQRSRTISELQDNNRRLGADLSAARQKLQQMIEADHGGLQKKVDELVDELKAARERIAELEGSSTADGEIVSDFAQELAAAKQRIAELENAGGAPDAWLIGEISRIAQLSQGFKKELETLVETVKPKEE